MRMRWVLLLGWLCFVTACAGPRTDVSEPESSSSTMPSSSTSSSPAVPPPSPTRLEWDEVFRQLGPGVVRISTATCDDESGMGSGFAISDRVVVTAAHVVSRARIMTVQTNSGVSAEAEPVGIVENMDVAVLRLNRSLDLPPLRLAEAVPDRGSELAVLGYPLWTYDLRIADGIVTGLPEPVEYEDQVVDRLFTVNAATNRGNSGGPVVDRKGQVIGLVSGSQNWDDDVPVQGVNFVVPVEDVQLVVDEWQHQTTSLADACVGEELSDGTRGSDHGLDVVSQDDSKLAIAVAQVLHTHGAAINRGVYDVAFALFTPDQQERLGGLHEWEDGVAASFWREIEVMEASLNDDESSATALVTLRTEQPPTGQVTDCSLWTIEYQFSIVDGQPLIDKARGQSTPC